MLDINILTKICNRLNNRITAIMENGFDYISFNYEKEELLISMFNEKNCERFEVILNAKEISEFRKEE